MTDFLYARPSWIDGVMSIIDLFAVAPEYNTSKTAAEADQKAYDADVRTIKEDFNIAYKKVVAGVK